MKALADSFADRRMSLSHRSSAVFPVYVDCNRDLNIVFLNYWTIKNAIPADSLRLNIRVYDEQGILSGELSCGELQNHNQFSIRSILSPSGCNLSSIFMGSAFVEIVSVENLVFRFPAIVGIYVSNGFYSVVHSAGRVKNSEELQEPFSSQETNWSCKFGDGVSPFFHYFNGPTLPREKWLDICLRDEQGKILKRTKCSVEDVPAFGSRTFFLKNLFGDVSYSDTYFASVGIEHNSAFKRLVVGNFHFEEGFPEVTHSFPLIETEDLAVSEAQDGYSAMLCGFTCAPLDLRIRIFPTNCPGDFSSDFYSQKFGTTCLGPRAATPEVAALFASRGGSYTLNPSEQFVVFRIRGQRVPSRLNASFVYSVRGVRSKFSTDIASGTVPSSYPEKFRHWGHGYCADGFDTVLMIRNNSLVQQCSAPNAGLLKIYGTDFFYSYSFVVGGESSLTLSFADIISNSDDRARINKKNFFLSWFIEMSAPTVDTFWICFRYDDGAIFGEHGF